MVDLQFDLEKKRKISPLKMESWNIQSSFAAQKQHYDHVLAVRDFSFKHLALM